MRLSKRMHMVADLVTPGMVLADIGCDTVTFPYGLSVRK